MRPQACVALERWSDASRHRGAEPLRVDLVSAVHVGDASYYEALQERLCVPDRVLYELVANKPQQPPGADRWRPAAPSRRRRRIRNPVALAQQFIAAALRLELQLELLDYCALHATQRGGCHVSCG